MFDRKRMSLKEKIGQFLMVSFKGPMLDRETKRFLKEFSIGGVILFKDNLADETKAVSLCNEIKGIGKTSSYPIPLFIAVDQEGGRVSRLQNLIPPVPPAGAMGQTGSTELVGSYFRRMARELRLLGINMNMAPVLDIHTNEKNPVIGDRAFGRDYKTVARLGIEAAKALHDEGIIAVGKHFPGHGDTSLDSHLDLPELPHDKKRLKRVELKPFRAAIGSVFALMTAHVLYRGVDPLYPATLSRKILHDLLRKELGFGGVVISDDLMMKAVTGRYEIGEAAVLAKNAGVDILLVCHSREAAARVFESLIRSAEKKEVLLRTVDMSLNRILKLKERYL